MSSSLPVPMRHAGWSAGLSAAPATRIVAFVLARLALCFRRTARQGTQPRRHHRSASGDHPAGHPANLGMNADRRETAPLRQAWVS